ncbi:protein disulfide oxidoreductase [Psychrobacter lutiphocae]|uniref:protein disulfide oxidoreductase n=1 Tax=Psychrobacter lutiphocae TaxID=540500 RepID=UPI0012EA1A7D|nr:protein disulfide oxidoreductase [Psychrobacter lutiphocae]
MGWVWTLSKYLIIFVVIYTVINWWRQPVMPADPKLQLIDYQGELVDLEQLSQQSPVLVYFWGTWCGVCKVTSPTINTLSQQNNYPIVTIAVNSGSNQDLHQYMAEHNYTFTTINDPNGAIFDQWQGQVTPSYVVLKNGEMTQGLTGIQPKWSLKLRLWLSSLV